MKVVALLSFYPKLIFVFIVGEPVCVHLEINNNMTGGDCGLAANDERHAARVSRCARVGRAAGLLSTWRLV